MLLPLILTIASVAVLLAPLLLKVPDPPLWIPLLLFGCGVAWTWALWFLREDRAALVLAGVQIVGAAGFAWWFFGLSSYVAPDGAPRASADAPDIEAVRVADGAAFRLSGERGRPVVLVFFRGSW